MSNEPQSQAQAAPAQPQKSTASGAMGAGTIVSIGAGTLGAVVGAGWPGVIIICLLSFAGIFGMSFIIRELNKRTDQMDRDRAGADAGNNAVKLSQEGQAVSGSLDSLEQSNPPAKPNG